MDSKGIESVFDTAARQMKLAFRSGDNATCEKWGSVIRLLSEKWPEETAPMIARVEHVVLKRRQ